VYLTHVWLLPCITACLNEWSDDTLQNIFWRCSKAKYSISVPNSHVISLTAKIALGVLTQAKSKLHITSFSFLPDPSETHFIAFIVPVALLLYVKSHCIGSLSPLNSGSKTLYLHSIYQSDYTVQSTIPLDIIIIGAARSTSAPILWQVRNCVCMYVCA